MSTAGAENGSELMRLPQRTPFTMVDNPIIRAMSDYVALGLYLEMLSYPSGWRINIRELARTHKQGRQVLTDAMNDLIARGLVFRVRYQEAGLWRTRTYVCSTPVTLSELDGVRAQYSGRCLIETSTDLSAALDQRLRAVEDAETSETQEVGGSQDTAGREPKPLVAPSARFPASGEPAAGLPDAGEPAAGDLAPQRLDLRKKIPPPSPDDDGREEEEEDAGGSENRHPELDSVESALSDAWPQLGRRDLQRLRPLVGEALSQLPTSELVTHLTTNTGGVLHPAAVLRARLGNLPPPRRGRRSTPWCGQCTSSSYRWIQDDDGRPVEACPRCSPQAGVKNAIMTTIDEEQTG